MANDGKKIKTNPNLSGGGKIITKYSRPFVDSLYLEGYWALNQRLTLQYQLTHPNLSQFKDVSRFFWGEKDTLNRAKFTNTDYSLSPFSPNINEEMIGKVLEVSILPIIENSEGIKVVGRPKVVDTSHSENQLNFPPTIKNLSVNSVGKLRTRPTASYEFLATGYAPGEDNSIFSWYLLHENGTKEKVFSGDIQKSGEISSGPELLRVWNGKSLELQVTAIDSNGIEGNQLTEQITIESAISLNIESPTNQLILGQAKEITLRGVATYSLGSIYEVTSEGIWSSSDSDVIVLNNGVTKLANSASSEKEVKITFTYDGFTAEYIIYIIKEDKVF